MPPGRYALFAAASALYLAWIGYLVSLVLAPNQPVARGTRPTVLSRPQFAVATDDVVVFLGDPHPREARLDVPLRWSGNDGAAGNVIRILNLDECTGWAGEGEYLLPLVSVGDTGKPEFKVPAIPRNPGLPNDPEATRPRIYRMSPAVQEQYDHMQHPDRRKTEVARPAIK